MEKIYSILLICRLWLYIYSLYFSARACDWKCLPK